MELDIAALGSGGAAVGALVGGALALATTDAAVGGSEGIADGTLLAWGAGLEGGGGATCVEAGGAALELAGAAALAVPVGATSVRSVSMSGEVSLQATPAEAISTAANERLASGWRVNLDWVREIILVWPQLKSLRPELGRLPQQSQQAAT
jgi:hypothetical protein